MAILLSGAPLDLCLQEVRDKLAGLKPPQQQQRLKFAKNPALYEYNKELGF